MAISLASGGPNNDEDRPSDTFTPQEERFKQTEYHGAFGINQMILEMTMKLADECVSATEGVDRVEAHIKGIWERLPEDHPEKNTWDWREQRKQIVNAYLGHIMKKCGERPRVIDALPDKLKNKWHEILRRGGEPELFQGAGRPDPDWGSWRIRDTGPAAEIPTSEEFPTMEAPKNDSRKKAQKIEAIPFKAFAEKDLPAREFLFGKHYQRGQCTCSIGQDGAGKSSVSIAEAICMALALPMLGEQPKQRYRVWLHNADDDSTEINRRIAAVCKLHGISMTDLEGWLFVTGKDNFKIKVVKGNAGGSIPDMTTIADIIKTVRENEIDVAIFDPLIHLHTVIENNNTQLAEVAEQFSDIANICECSIDIVHHVRKMMNGVNEKEFTSEDSRGGGALRAAVRALRVYNRMTTDEAENAGVAVDMRGFYLRVDRGKANYLPPAIRSTWFHLASVVLDNGDDVGAIEPWTYPGQGEGASPMEKKGEDLFMFLLLRQKNVGRPVSPAHNAQDYAPKVFARSKEAREAKVGVRHFKGAMDRLLDTGRISIAEERDGSRHPRRVIVGVDLRAPKEEEGNETGW